MRDASKRAGPKATAADPKKDGRGVPQASRRHASHASGEVPHKDTVRPAAREGAAWRDRTVLVVGLGASGLAAIDLLRRHGCRVRVTDRGDTPQLRQIANELRESGLHAVELGDHRRRMVEGCHAVIVSPGVPENAPPVRWAQALRIPVLSEIELAYRFCDAPVVAVTGTNGKSSVVTLIERLMKAVDRPAVACGNLGTPFASVVSTLPAGATVIVEVSSFQLAACDQFRPDIAVLLNLGTNHIDRHQTRTRYLAAKARLFQRQRPGDVAVLNAGDPDVVRITRGVRARKVWFGTSTEGVNGTSLRAATCRLLSENAQAVFQVGRLLGVPDPLAHQVIREFRGLEHRLEDLGSLQGVHIINDAKSTTPDSLLYALEWCRGPVVPIIGGRDKGLDFSPLSGPLSQERIRGVVLIGESRQRLRAMINGTVVAQECDTLEAAVQEALRMAQPGDTVLFSPACASFDMFRNFEQRGARFKQCVHARAQAITNQTGTSGHG